MKRKKNKKKKSYKYLFIIVLIITIGIVIYILYSNNKILEYKNKITIEPGESLPTINDYLYEDIETEEEIKWIDVNTEDDKVYKTGSYKGTFKHQKEELEVTLVVKDTTPPEINGVKDIEMLAYDIVPNLLEGVTATDNSLEEIKIEVQGEYNKDVVGKYTITYSAVDSSGNSTKEKAKLIVKENPNVKISKTSKGNIIKKYYDITYIDDVVVVNKTYKLPSNFTPNNLVAINGYIKVVDYVKTAFNELVSDSKSIGLNIYASSGYRSYADQKYIYNNYVKYDGQANADTYSARAGHSEHQTGLAIDVNTVDSSFEGTNESNWLKDNCHKYGFIIRYPKGKENITGYMYEPWHIRYVGKDLATTLYNNGNWVTIEEYYGIDSKYK